MSGEHPAAGGASPSLWSDRTKPEKMVLPQSGEVDSAWVQPADRWALICRPLRAALARHFFTEPIVVVLGSAPAAGLDAWREIAEAIDTSPEHVARTRQVHGADTLLRPGGAVPPGPLVAADIIAGDDTSMALAIVTADCGPILIGDRRTGRGRRGPRRLAGHRAWRRRVRRQRDVQASLGSRPAGSGGSDWTVNRSLLLRSRRGRSRARFEREGILVRISRAGSRTTRTA